MKVLSAPISSGVSTLITIILAVSFLSSCKTGPINLFKAASPHELYERKLINSGLHKSAMGLSWINEGKERLEKAVPIKLPYLEKGYFAAEEVGAAAFSFRLTRGQELQAKLSRIPKDGFMIYMDLWELQDNGTLKLIAAADTLGLGLKTAISRTATYVLRLQPELLIGGSYTLELGYGPSLAYPLKSSGKNQIQSFFGDGRDANSRKHEGIDIFAPFRTPVLAIASGTITRVNENNLGGRVVWLRPDGQDYTLYYAHLDEQIAREGERVNIGDTIGLMGNTGNAKTTAPHLHFGIYTSGGAVDPLPFIAPVATKLRGVDASLAVLHTSMRTSGAAVLTDHAPMTGAAGLKSGTVVHINAATGGNYRVNLPDGSMGYLKASQLVPVTKALERYTTSAVETPVFSRPAAIAAVKQTLKAGEVVSILGTFDGYRLISDADKQTGWIR